MKFNADQMTAIQNALGFPTTMTVELREDTPMGKQVTYTLKTKVGGEEYYSSIAFPMFHTVPPFKEDRQDASLKDARLHRQ